MKKTLASLLGSCLLVATSAWPDPLKEVAEVGAPRAKAYMAGDLDGWTGAYAENAVFFSSFAPFRIEGKAAIRASFAEHFNQFTNRRYFLRQAQARVYGDNLVIGDGHYEIHVTERGGKHTIQYGRYSVVWARLDGRWQIVSHHNSAINGM